MIPVTKPFLPERAAYDRLLDGVFERNWLTNNGPVVNRLERELAEYLGTPNLSFVTNGTIAIQLVIKAFGLKGSVITTPFSYVATTSSLSWEGVEVIFADIDADTLNISPAEIERVIRPDTVAILATHCFGNACDIAAIEEIAAKHDLRVIYDAAHCFGTTYQGKSIFAYGDAATTSFHATKLFHTVEGGAVFVRNAEHLQAVNFAKNFGHNGPETFTGVGINGKNSEFHAAMGLAVLPRMAEVLDRRREQCERYDRLFEGAHLRRPTITEGCGFNHAYYATIFPSETLLMEVMTALRAADIHPRRYFYPSLSSLDYVTRQATPICDDISSRILCLPLYHDLTKEDQARIAKCILTTIQ